MRRCPELYIEKALSVSQFTPVAVPVPDSGFQILDPCFSIRPFYIVHALEHLFVCLIGWVLTQSFTLIQNWVLLKVGGNFCNDDGDCKENIT